MTRAYRLSSWREARIERDRDREKERDGERVNYTVGACKDRVSSREKKRHAKLRNAKRFFFSFHCFFLYFLVASFSSFCYLALCGEYFAFLVCYFWFL